MMIAYTIKFFHEKRADHAVLFFVDTINGYIIQWGHVEMKKKIFIIGQMGSGKDTVKDLLSDILERRGVKPAQGKLGKYIRAHVDEMFYKGMTPTKRQAYQEYAEGMKKIFGQDHWCRILSEESKDVDADVLIVADMRQQHEYEFFNDQDAVFIGVEAPESERIKRMSKRDGEKQDMPSLLTHVSETAPKNLIMNLKLSKNQHFYYVENDKDLTALSNKVEALVEMLELDGFIKGVEMHE